MHVYAGECVNLTTNSHTHTHMHTHCHVPSCCHDEVRATQIPQVMHTVINPPPLQKKNQKNKNTHLYHLQSVQDCSAGFLE